MKTMDRKRFKGIKSALEGYELTMREKQFVEAVERYFNENGKVTDQQESILEGIYREITWIRRTFLSQNDLPRGSSSKGA